MSPAAISLLATIWFLLIGVVWMVGDMAISVRQMQKPWWSDMTFGPHHKAEKERQRLEEGKT